MKTNDRLIASLRGKFKLTPSVQAATDTELLQAYTLFRSASDTHDNNAWQRFPSYVEMGTSGRANQWNGLFNRKNTTDPTRLGPKIVR